MLLGLFLSPVFSLAAQAQSAVTEQEAQAIAADAYIYFYALVTMDLTRKQLTNMPPGKGVFGGPMNMFVNVEAFPPADFKGVVRPNFDTLYSSAYLDLTKEPMVVSVPDTGGRYYLLPMLDMWSDVFASPGWRTTGTQAGNFLVTPSRRGVGAEPYRQASRASKHRRLMSGSSAAPRRAARRITMRFTKSRPVTRSRRYPNGTSRQSPSRSRSIQASI
jgi:hypothetical protein